MNPGTSAINPVVIAEHRTIAFNNHHPAVTVLTSWKDIARYMGKGVRTVQRWEQDFGLPVRRPQGSNKKAVLARPRDLDAWVAMRCSSRAELSLNLPAPRVVSTQSLSSLTSGIETSRLLLKNNRALLAEVSVALEALRRQVCALASARDGGNSGPPIQ